MNLSGFASAGVPSIYDRLAGDASARQKIQDIQNQALADRLLAAQVTRGAMGDLRALDPGRAPPPQATASPQPGPAGGGQQPAPSQNGAPPASADIYNNPGVAPPNNPFMGGGGQPQGQGAPQAAPQQAQAPQGAPQQPQQPQVPPGGFPTVQSMAQQIIRANPRVNWRNPKNQMALVKAVEAGQHLLAPQAKAELAEAKQQLAQQKAQMDYDAKVKAVDQRADAAIRAAESRTQVAEINSARDRAKAEIAAAAHVQGITINVEGKHQDVKTTEEGKAKRQETSEEGKDTRQATAEEGKVSRLATAEAGRNQRVAAKPGGAQGVQGINAQIRVISSKISDMFRGGLVTMDDIKADPGKKAEYDRLVAQRDALAESAGKAGVKVEPFDAKPKAAPKEAPKEAAALPDDLPPAKGLADGTTAKSADGKVVAVIRSGAWATP